MCRGNRGEGEKGRGNMEEEAEEEEEEDTGRRGSIAGRAGERRGGGEGKAGRESERERR